MGYSPWGCKELDTTENAPTTTLSPLRHTDNPGAWSSGLGNLIVQPFILLSRGCWPPPLSLVHLDSGLSCRSPYKLWTLRTVEAEMAPTTRGHPPREHLHFLLPQTTSRCHVPEGACDSSASPSPAACPTLLRSVTPSQHRWGHLETHLETTCQTAGSCRYTQSFKSSSPEGPLKSWSVFYGSSPSSKPTGSFLFHSINKSFDTRYHMCAEETLVCQEKWKDP